MSKGKHFKGITENVYEGIIEIDLLFEGMGAYTLYIKLLWFKNVYCQIQQHYENIMTTCCQTFKFFQDLFQ